MAYDSHFGSNEKGRKSLPKVLQPSYINSLNKSNIIYEIEIPKEERSALERMCKFHVKFLDLQMELGGEGPRTIAKIMAAKFDKCVPILVSHLLKVREGKFKALYIKGLPKEKRFAEHLTLALTYKLGKPFAYSSQHQGRLVMPLGKEPSSRYREGKLMDSVNLHSDDAIVPRECRAEWICTFFVNNSSKTKVGYVPISYVIEELSEESKDVLFSKTALFGAPERFNLGKDVWVGPRSIISLSPDRIVEVAWPSWATRSVNKSDQEMEYALNEMKKIVEYYKRTIIPSSGSFLILNNFRGLNMRSRVTNGNFYALRTYARRNLSALRHVTKSNGFVFDLRPILEPEMVRH